MEALKGVIYYRGKVDGKHRYLVAFQIVTDHEIAGLVTGWSQETVIMSVKHLSHFMSEALDDTTKYVPPFPLGEISSAVMTACESDPSRLVLVSEAAAKAAEEAEYDAEVDDD